jgi:hypothetical protein
MKGGTRQVRGWVKPSGRSDHIDARDENEHGLPRVHPLDGLATGDRTLTLIGGSATQDERIRSSSYEE